MNKVVAIVTLYLTFSCCRTDDSPYADYPNQLYTVGDTVASFLFTQKNSYWIYKSNDDLYDTVTQILHDYDTIQYVDDNQIPVSQHLHFTNIYFSTYDNESYRVRRIEVSPFNPAVYIELQPAQLASTILFQTPNMVGEIYTAPNGNNIQVLRKSDTTINNKTHAMWEIKYGWWTRVNAISANATWIADIGLHSIHIPDSNRTWHLIDYHVIK